MPGHMGNVRRTTQNLEIVSVDEEENLLVIKVLADQNLILIEGAVPGPKGGTLELRKK